MWSLAAYAQQDDRVRALKIGILSLQAEATATKISQFFHEIEGQMGSTTELTWPDATLEQQRSQFARMLRQLPAITELAQLDASGREQLRVSRAEVHIRPNTDYSTTQNSVRR